MDNYNIALIGAEVVLFTEGLGKCKERHSVCGIWEQITEEGASELLKKEFLTWRKGVLGTEKSKCKGENLTQSIWRKEKNLWWSIRCVGDWREVIWFRL
jgi:hypothetical protein